MGRVITYGTFDYFHYGHYSILERASKLGDGLIVGVSSDAMAASKGKATLLSETRRMEIISNLKFVEKVILEETMEQKISDINKYGVDTFVLGNDYKDLFPKMAEYEKLIEKGVRIIFLHRTPDISTTSLKEKLFEQNKMNQESGTIHNLTNK